MLYCDGVKKGKRGEFAAFRLNGGITAFEQRRKLAANWMLGSILPQRLDEKEIIGRFTLRKQESDELRY